MKNIITFLREWTMRNKYGLIAVFILGFAAGAAIAGQATLTWTNPSQNTDGTALPASQITGTRIEYGTCSGTAFGTKTGESTATGAATTLTITGLAPGNTCFRLYTGANGTESAPSNVGQKVIPQAPPNPPVLVTIAATVYDVRFTGRKFVLNRPVGTMELGSACSKDFRIGDYARVDRKAVHYSVRYRPSVVVAKCGPAVT